jgi:hypothetical protein
MIRKLTWWKQEYVDRVAGMSLIDLADEAIRTARDSGYGDDNDDWFRSSVTCERLMDRLEQIQGNRTNA